MTQVVRVLRLALFVRMALAACGAQRNVSFGTIDTPLRSRPPVLSCSGGRTAEEQEFAFGLGR